MADPEILDVRGREVEIVVWRHTDNLFEATLQDVDGNPVNLDNSQVTMVIVDRAGGTVKFEQTNEPGSGHVDEANGITRFSVPRATFAGLTVQRAYTWKYWIYRYTLLLEQRTPHFFGDVRVMAPPATISEV